MVNQLCNSYWLVPDSLISRQGVFPGLIGGEGFLSEKYVHFPKWSIHSFGKFHMSNIIAFRTSCLHISVRIFLDQVATVFIGIHVYQTVLSSLVGTSYSGSWMLVYKFDKIIDVLFLVNRIASSFSFCFLQAMPVHSFPK